MLIDIDGSLNNGEVGPLVDEPLLTTELDGLLCLTTDQWASLIRQRRAAGRQLHLSEVR